MNDLIIGIISTLITTIIIGLWGTLIIVPYQEHMKIYKAILHLSRNYDDPRKYIGDLTPTSLMINCIQKQREQIEEILDSVLELKELSRFTYWFFNYPKLEISLNFLFNYTNNPIMLDKQKEFSDDYTLNQDAFFAGLKKAARLPKIKIILLFLIPTIALITVILMAIYCFIVTVKSFGV